MNKTSFPKKYCAVLAAALTLLIGTPINLHAASSTATSADQTSRRDRLKHLLLKKFDANHNGKLDPDEVDALKKWLGESRAKKSRKR